MLQRCPPPTDPPTVAAPGIVETAGIAGGGAQTAPMTRKLPALCEPPLNELKLDVPDCAGKSNVIESISRKPPGNSG